MSEPRVSTGKTRTGACEACGSDVEQHEYVGAYKLEEGWSNEPHDAPCGLPCFGARIHGRVYKTARVTGIHRKDNCPKCNEMTS